MSADDRLTRLRALIGRLERLPASPETEWMLREARARMVDVETGEQPSGMRPREEDPPAEPPRRGRDAAVKRPTRPRPSAPEPRHAPAPDTPTDDGSKPVDIAAGTDRSAASLGTDGLLWLDDSPTEADPSPAGAEGDPASHPWRRGLRG